MCICIACTHLTALKTVFTDNRDRMMDICRICPTRPKMGGSAQQIVMHLKFVHNVASISDQSLNFLASTMLSSLLGGSDAWSVLQDFCAQDYQIFILKQEQQDLTQQIEINNTKLSEQETSSIKIRQELAEAKDKAAQDIGRLELHLKAVKDKSDGVLTKERNDFTQSLQAYQEKILEAGIQNDRFSKKICALKKTLLCKEETINDITKKLNAETEKVVSLQADLVAEKQLSDRSATKQKEIDELQERLVSKEQTVKLLGLSVGENAKFKKEVKELEAKILTLTEKLTDQEVTLPKLDLEKTSFEDKAAGDFERLEELRLKAVEERYGKDQAMMNPKMKKLEIENARLAEVNSNLKSSLTEMKYNWAETLQSYGEECCRLRKNLQAQAKDNEFLTTQNKAQREELAKPSSNACGCEVKTSKHESKQRKTTDLKNLEVAKNSSTDNNNTIELDTIVKTSAIELNNKTLREKVTTLTAKNIIMEETIKKSEDLTEQLRKDLTNAGEKNVILFDELNQLKTIVGELRSQWENTDSCHTEELEELKKLRDAMQEELDAVKTKQLGLLKDLDLSKKLNENHEILNKALKRKVESQIKERLS